MEEAEFFRLILDVLSFFHYSLSLRGIVIRILHEKRKETSNAFAFLLASSLLFLAS